MTTMPVRHWQAESRCHGPGASHSASLVSSDLPGDLDSESEARRATRHHRGKMMQPECHDSDDRTRIASAAAGKKNKCYNSDIILLHDMPVFQVKFNNVLA
jgi:hypothetical protein